MFISPRILIPGLGPGNLHFTSILGDSVADEMKHTLRSTDLVHMSQWRPQRGGDAPKVSTRSSATILALFSPFSALASNPPPVCRPRTSRISTTDNLSKEQILGLRLGPTD